MEPLLRKIYAQADSQQKRMANLIVALVRNSSQDLSWHQRFNNIYLSVGGTTHPDINKIVKSLELMNWEVPMEGIEPSSLE